MTFFGYCTPYASEIVDDPPEREFVTPGSLSTFGRFWSAATPWQAFLLPAWTKGPAIQHTKAKPGVYELGASIPGAPGTVIPLYVGKSINLRSRHEQYLRDGDHLAALMRGILADGCTIYVRVRYLRSDIQAQRWEALFLVNYDYAWNRDLNPPKRALHLEGIRCCCSHVGVDISDANGTKKAAVLLNRPLQKFTYLFIRTALIIQALLAVSSICIVAVQLSQSVGQIQNGTSVQQQQSCFLGLASQGNSLCTYAYIVSASSIAIAVVLASIMECSNHPGRWCRGAAKGPAAGAMALWWGIAGIVFNSYALQANRVDVPKASWRTAVVALSWIDAGLWGLCFAAQVMHLMVSCCGGRARRIQPTLPYAEGAPAGWGQENYATMQEDPGLPAPTAPPLADDWPAPHPQHPMTRILPV